MQPHTGLGFMMVHSWPRRAGGLGIIVATLVASGARAAQEPPTPDELARAAAVHQAVGAIRSALGDDLWPGFDLQGRPVLYTGLGGGLLAGWSDELPPGFQAVDGPFDLAWSPQPAFGPLMARGTTLTSLDEDYSLPQATALAVHEDFHGHQRSAARAGASFGTGDRPAAVRHYPAFDTANAVGVALEGKLLAEALSSGSQGARERLREFSLVRKHRCERLSEAMAAWERGAEWNEGLADYVAVRALDWIIESDYAGWGEEAEKEEARLLARLDRLVELAESSLRRRFYATGSAQALLLDRLAPGWKERMLREDVALEDLVRETVGGSSGSEADLSEVAERYGGLSVIRREVAGFLGRLAEARHSLARDLLAAPGLRVTLDTDGRGTICGLDPLNVRHIDATRVLHPSFLRVCSGDESLTAQFGTAALEDVDAGIFTVVVANPDDVEVIAAGHPIDLEGIGTAGVIDGLGVEAPGFSLEAKRVRVERNDRDLRIETIP